MTRDQLLELCAQLSAEAVELRKTIEAQKNHIDQLDHQLSCEQEQCMCQYPDDCTGACCGCEYVNQ